MRIGLAALFAIALAASASAQDVAEDDAYLARFTQFENALHDTRQGSARWTIVFSRIDAFGERWEIVSFGRDRDHAKDWPRVWGARLLIGGVGIDQRAFRTDSHSCPAMRDQLSSMEHLIPPRIDLPGVGRDRRPTTAVMDGYDYRLWTAFGVYEGPRRTDGAIELNGNVDTQLAVWGERLIVALERCWQSEG